MIEVVVTLLMPLGLFSPLLFINPWMDAIGKWMAGKPGLHNFISNGRELHLGRFPVAG
jgi:hypothetical protein